MTSLKPGVPQREQLSLSYFRLSILCLLEKSVDMPVFWPWSHLYLCTFSHCPSSTIIMWESLVLDHRYERIIKTQQRLGPEQELPVILSLMSSSSAQPVKERWLTGAARSIISTCTGLGVGELECVCFITVMLVRASADWSYTKKKLRVGLKTEWCAAEVRRWFVFQSRWRKQMLQNKTENHV